MSINCRLQAVDAATTGRLTADPIRAPLSLARTQGPRCDIHKAWHAIHYVLTGTADGGEPPDCYLLDGGTALGPPGDDEDGYGPPRLLRPDQVREFNEVLQPISRLSVLRERFDHAGMVSAGVYSVNDDGEDEDLEFTAHFFKGLRKFIRGAAERGDGVVVSMY